MGAPPAADPVERLWKTARYLPQTVRLLGTRYRTLFLAHAQRCRPRGEAGIVADALAFADYLAKQERVGLLAPGLFPWLRDRMQAQCAAMNEAVRDDVARRIAETV